MHVVSARAVSKLARELDALGLPARPVLEALELTGLGEDDWLPWRRFVELKAQIAQRLDDEGVGAALARVGTLESFELLGLLVNHQPTLGHALEAFIDHMALWQRGPVVHLERAADGAVVTYETPDVGLALGERVDVQQSLCAIFLTAEQLAQARLPLFRIEFRQPPPRDGQRAFDDLFSGRPVRFSAPRNALVFGPEALQSAVLGGDPRVLPYLEDAARETAARGPGLADRLDEQIQQILVASFPDKVDVEDVARRLGMSRRTLARRLADLGTSFRALVERARRTAAQDLVRDPAIPLGEVAWRLGYATQPSFHRAFQRWFGVAPGSYRRGAD